MIKIINIIREYIKYSELYLYHSVNASSYDLIKNKITIFSTFYYYKSYSNSYISISS